MAQLVTATSPNPYYNCSKRISFWCHCCFGELSAKCSCPSQPVTWHPSKSCYCYKCDCIVASLHINSKFSSCSTQACLKIATQTNFIRIYRRFYSAISEKQIVSKCPNAISMQLSVMYGVIIKLKRIFVSAACSHGNQYIP